MRLALDCRTVTRRKTGDRTYALGLAGALPRVAPEIQIAAFLAEPPAAPLPEAPNLEWRVLPARPEWAWTPFAFPRALRAAKASLAHVQYLVPPDRPCPFVTTIHDLAFLRFPQLFPAKHRILLSALIPLAVRWARRILTGSRATRDDLVSLLGVPEDRIDVTPYAADPMFHPREPDAVQAARDRYGLREPYLLSVGLLQPRKNLPRLIRAYARIAREVPHRLVVVGREGWETGELRAAAAALPEDRQPLFPGYVPDEDLPLLYCGADLFAYPSLYEGFGLPVLEAMACGTPVLTSSTSSLPEVAGDAAVLVDPTDEAALAAALAELLLDPARRAALSEAGLIRSREFSWQQTARLTVAAYRKVVEW